MNNTEPVPWEKNTGQKYSTTSDSTLNKKEQYL